MAAKKAPTPKKAPGGISKMEGVRRAMADLGSDAKPLRIQSYVQEKFGIEMNTDTISTYKAGIARAAAKAKAATQTPASAAISKPAAPAPTAAAAPAPPSVASPTNGQAASIPLQDILLVKELVGRVGADNLRKLIDVLS